jgi:hypothetical protein
MLAAGKATGAGGSRGAGIVNFIASGSGSGTTVTHPATVLAGDILLVGLHQYADTNGGGPTIPSGWTRIGFAAAAPWNASPAYRVMTALYYKLATGSEGSSTAGFAFLAEAGGPSSHTIGMYRPTFSTASVTVADVAQNASTATETITSGSATGYKGVISCFSWGTYAPSSFCTMSPSPTVNVQVAGSNGGQLIATAFNQTLATNATVTVGVGSFGVACVSAYLSLS